MTAAEVPKGADLVLRDVYDSREGQCGTIRIRAEALWRLRQYGLMSRNSIYQTTSNVDGVTGVVEIIASSPEERTFVCCASIQPSAECELVIYEQPSKYQRPDN